MRWLLAATRLWWLLPASLVAGGMSALAIDATISVPLLDQGFAFSQVRASVVAPLAAVALFSAIGSRTSTLAAAVSSRCHAVMLNVTMWTLIVLFGMAHQLTLIALAREPDLDAVRNGFGYAALMFAAQNVVGSRAAPLVPVAYAVIGTIFSRVDGILQPWAWHVGSATPRDVAVAVSISVACSLGSGVAAFVRGARFYDTRSVLG
jgi:hypothetical protein